MQNSIICHFQRYELKYWLTENQYQNVKKQMAAFMELDQHSQSAPHNRYPLWSLYLDSKNLSCYWDKQDGISCREKFRLRSYNAVKPYENASEDLIFAEIKRKENKVILKDRIPLKLKDAQELIENNWNHLEDDALTQFERSTLNRFLFSQHRLGLAPCVAIRYDREAYFGHIDKNVRITFDRNVSGRQCQSLREMFAPQSDWIPCKNPLIIMEIKVYNQIPLWAVEIVRRNGLSVSSISKYCDTVETLYNEQPFKMIGV